jgi:hypothetical protein
MPSTCAPSRSPTTPPPSSFPGECSLNLKVLLAVASYQEVNPKFSSDFGVLLCQCTASSMAHVPSTPVSWFCSPRIGSFSVWSRRQWVSYFGFLVLFTFRHFSTLCLILQLTFSPSVTQVIFVVCLAKYIQYIYISKIDHQRSQCKGWNGPRLMYSYIHT